MPEDDRGLPLKEALEAFADPELWRAFQEALERAARIPPRPNWITSSRERREAWSNRYEGALPAACKATQQAGTTVVADLKRRLRAGELEATGLRYPYGADPHPEVIPAHLWDVLALNLEASTARDRELEFRGVRVRRALQGSGGGAPLGSGQPAVTLEDDERVETAPGEDAAAKPDSGPPPEGAEQPRKPGRPSMMDVFRDELVRQAADGELDTPWGRKARELHAWAVREFPGQKLPSAESIEKQLRPFYRQLQQDKKRG